MNTIMIKILGVILFIFLAGCDEFRGDNEDISSPSKKFSGLNPDSRGPAIKISYVRHSTSITQLPSQNTGDVSLDADASSFFGIDGKAVSDTILGAPIISVSSFQAIYYKDGHVDIESIDITPEKDRPSSFGVSNGSMEGLKTVISSRSGRVKRIDRSGKVVYENDVDIPSHKPMLEKLIELNKKPSTEEDYSSRRKAIFSDLGFSPQLPFVIKDIETYKSVGGSIENLSKDGSLIRISIDIGNANYQALAKNVSPQLRQPILPESQFQDVKVYYDGKRGRVLGMDHYDYKGHLKVSYQYEYRLDDKSSYSSLSVDDRIASQIPTISYTEVYSIGGERRPTRFVTSSRITDLEISNNLIDKKD